MSDLPIHAHVSKWELTPLTCGHTAQRRDYYNGVQMWEQWADLQEHFISRCPTCGAALRVAPTTIFGKTPTN
jgi:hypothetical protein